MKRLIIFALSLMLLGSVSYAANLDDFDGPDLNKIWTHRDPANTSDFKFSGGKMILDLKAGADMFRLGVDRGIMFLTDPPDQDNFTVEMLLNVAVKGTQPPACQVGIVFFNEKKWAYSIWGPYAAQDIRVEDCIGADYRWRAEAQIGIDQVDVKIDQDVYLQVVKTGNTLEFFAKGAAGENWKSGGKDQKLGPNYTKGDYQIGIVAKSWGGSVDSTFELDYFNVPELTLSVEPAGKLATTWGDIKGN
jgi:hypothetical protein